MLYILDLVIMFYKTYKRIYVKMFTFNTLFYTYKYQWLEKNHLKLKLNCQQTYLFDKSTFL